jgi:hypothetical protein
LLDRLGRLSSVTPERHPQPRPRRADPVPAAGSRATPEVDMTPNDAVPVPSEDALQFDTAIASSGAADAALPDAPTAQTCAECARPIAERYYAAGSTIVCPECRGRIDALLGAPVGTSGYLRAVLFGLGASLAGAVIWFAVYKLLNLEIGLIAIAVGWMVGRAMQKGARGRGSRRLQVSAALLTYAAVALSYTAIVVDQTREERGGASARPTAVDSVSTRATAPTRSPDSTTRDSTPTAAAAPAAGASSAAREGGESAKGGPATFLLGLGALIALPVLANLSDLPMGLIGLFILFIGIRQAWHMTRRVEIAFEGPFRVGAND